MSIGPSKKSRMERKIGKSPAYPWAFETRRVDETVL